MGRRTFALQRQTHQVLGKKIHRNCNNRDDNKIGDFINELMYSHSALPIHGDEIGVRTATSGSSEAGTSARSRALSSASGRTQLVMQSKKCQLQHLSRDAIIITLRAR